MPKVFAIYPTDKQQSTKFLNRINTYLKRKLQNDWHCYKTKFTDADHTKCIEVASKNDAKFIVFMGHGMSERLFGSCAKYSSDFISIEASQHNVDFYKNEGFITSENIANFKGKIFFSFSCFSNKNHKGSLGRIAIENGILSFVGFGDIPTDFILENAFPIKAISIFKGIITKIIKQSILISIKNNYSVGELVDLIKILTIKEIQYQILSNHKNRHKEKIIGNLFLFKKEIVIFGNRFETIS